MFYSSRYLLSIPLPPLFDLSRWVPNLVPPTPGTRGESGHPGYIPTYHPHMRHCDTNVDQKLSHDKVLSVSGHPGVASGWQVCSVKYVMDVIAFKRNSEKWAIRTHFLPDIFSGVWDWAPDPASAMSSYLTQWPLADASADSPELWLSDTRQRLIFDLRMWA